MGFTLPLILVPTHSECQVIREAFCIAGRDDLLVKCCGFGPIAAAARTADLLARTQPSVVMLLGIAGSFPGQGTLGNAYHFGKVACHGVGVGTAAAFESAAAIGWPQTVETQQDRDSDDANDVISLATPTDDKAKGRLLLTACASCGGKEDMVLRQKFLPNIFAEDMEGFGVALACQQGNTPCMIIRGLSNRVGDRDKNNWKIKEPLRAAAALALESLTVA